MPQNVGAIGLTRRGSHKAVEEDEVNQQGGWVRRKIVWLPETYTDPNSRLENLAEPDSPKC